MSIVSPERHRRTDWTRAGIAAQLLIGIDFLFHKIAKR